MKKPNRWQVFALIGLFAFTTRGNWVPLLDFNPPIDGPAVENPFPDITAALREDGRPERTQQFANLWAGMGEMGVPSSVNLVGVQRYHSLAVALLNGPDGKPSGVGKLIAAELEAIIAGKPLMLTDEYRVELEQFYRDLAVAFGEAAK